MWPIIPLLALAAPAAMVHPQANHAKARLVFEQTGVTPGGTVMAAVVFDIEKTWHLYWDGQNDSGQPPTFDKDKLPAGVTLGEVVWPAPERQVLEGDIVDHIYANRLVMLVPVTVAKDAKPGSSLKLDLPVRWMECASVCQLGESTVTGTLRVVAKPDEVKPSPDAKVIQAAQAVVPKAPQDGSVKIELAGDTLTVAVKGAVGLTFMPASAGAPAADLAHGVTSKGDTLAVKLKGDPKKGPTAAVGFLSVERGKSRQVFLVDTRVKAAERKENRAEPEAGHPASGTAPKR
jgi:DsbC/DsbD-like thiol-disulfide interchange protein